MAGDKSSAGRWRRWGFHGWTVGGLLAAFVYLGLYTVPDYGLMWDFWEYYIGDKNLAFWTSFNWDYIRVPIIELPAYQLVDNPDWFALLSRLQGNDAQVAPHLIWPFGPTLAAISQAVFYRGLGVFDAIGARHAGQVLLVAVLMWTIYRFGRRHWGPWAGLTAAVVIGCYPRFWAHLHANVKDVPCAVLFAWVILLVVAGVRKERWGWLLGGAVLWGLALATKANALFLPFILGPWFVYVLWLRWRGKRRVVSKGVIGALAAFPVLGLGVMFVAWPLLLVDFPRTFVLYVQSLVSRGVHEGAGWNWLPLENALATMPVVVLVLAAAGLAETVWLTWRRRRLSPLRLLVLLWMVVPVGRVCLPGAADFDVIRHWLEFVPALALVAGWGAGWVARCGLRAMRRPGLRPVRRWAMLAALAAAFTPLLVWEVRNHPNELVFYNSLVGGAGGARERGFQDATDYWCYSYPQALDWLNEHAGRDSLVMAGVAEHVLFAVQGVWLRADLRAVPMTGKRRDELMQLIGEHRGEAYLFYVVRPEWYLPLVQEVDGQVAPAYEVSVDGAVILKVVRLK